MFNMKILNTMLQNKKNFTCFVITNMSLQKNEINISYGLLIH